MARIGKFNTGIFIGRFQPFHKGHLNALRFSMLHSKRLIIGVGSSQESGTEKNPIPAEGRIRIIKAALSGSNAGLHGIRFMKIPDFNDDEEWFEYIIKREPGIDAAFSRNRTVNRIFGGHGITVVHPPWYIRQRLAGTKIRKMIRKGKEWRDRVPRGAVKEISHHEKAIRRGAK